MVSAARLRDVYKLQSWIFNKAFNPNNERIGAKVLREPLKGDLLKDYYYPSLKVVPTPKKLNKTFPDWNCYDPDEDYRLERVEYLKRKGKGAPKKTSSKKEVSSKKKK